jgi:hypothetical protein
VARLTRLEVLAFRRLRCRSPHQEADSTPPPRASPRGGPASREAGEWPGAPTSPSGDPLRPLQRACAGPCDVGERLDRRQVGRPSGFPQRVFR